MSDNEHKVYRPTQYAGLSRDELRETERRLEAEKPSDSRDRSIAEINHEQRELDRDESWRNEENVRMED